jgi:hypothetical protein
LSPRTVLRDCRGRKRRKSARVKWQLRSVADLEILEHRVSDSSFRQAQRLLDVAISDLQPTELIAVSAGEVKFSDWTS